MNPLMEFEFPVQFLKIIKNFYEGTNLQVFVDIKMGNSLEAESVVLLYSRFLSTVFCVIGNVLIKTR